MSKYKFACADKELRKQNEIKFTHIRVNTKKKEVFAAKLVLFSPEILGISPQIPVKTKNKVFAVNWYWLRADFG